MQQQLTMADGNGGSSSNYLSVVQTCNTLIHSLSKNLWSKYFPEESTNGENVNLQFDIEPGDSTPRRVMVCLAKQVHNFKCVAKILERVKEAGKRRLNFQEAAQLGLIDRETGAFRNSATGEVLAPGEAINRGFFKAYPVEDPRSLDIQPENRITVTQFNKLKSRWSAVNAFAKARGGGGGGGGGKDT